MDVEVKVEPGMAPGCVLLAWSPLLGARDAVLAAAGYVPQRDLLRQEVTSKIIRAAIDCRAAELVVML